MATNALAQIDAYIQATLHTDPAVLNDSEWLDAAGRALFLHNQHCELLERIVTNAICKSFSR